LESNIDLGKSSLGGEFLLGNGGLFRSDLGPISNDWLDDLFKLFENGGTTDGGFDGRGVRRSRSSTTHIGSVSHRVRGTLGRVGRG